MNKTISKNLERLRKEHDLTQEALAEKLGVSRQAVSSWEQGNASPDTDNLIALARLYGVKVDDLLTDSGEQAEFKKRREAFFGMDIDDDTKETRRRKSRAASFPFPVLATIAFFMLGFGFDAWHPGWMVFLTIPIYYYIVTWVEQASGKADRHWMELFPYPLVVAAVFLLIGFFTNLWHPAWMLFLTIPVYYFVLRAIKHRATGWQVVFSGTIPILAVIAFLLIGFFVPGGWAWAWLVFLTIPIWGWLFKTQRDEKNTEDTD